MNRAVVARLRHRLTAAAGLADRGLAVEPIRVWRLSGVERLHTPGGVSVVFKYATAPFTREHLVLADLRRARSSGAEGARGDGAGRDARHDP